MNTLSATFLLPKEQSLVCLFVNIKPHVAAPDITCHFRKSVNAQQIQGEIAKLCSDSALANTTMVSGKQGHTTTS